MSTAIDREIANSEQFQEKSLKMKENYEEKWNHYDSTYKSISLRKAQLLNEWLSIAFDEQ
jgi:hypothetical protein